MDIYCVCVCTMLCVIGILFVFGGIVRTIWENTTRRTTRRECVCVHGGGLKERVHILAFARRKRNRVEFYMFSVKQKSKAI